MLKFLSIKYLSWYLRRKKINNLELVIRNDGYTLAKRNFKREEEIKKTLEKIK